MSIPDAIERAKKLYGQRNSGNLKRPDPQRAAADDTASLAALREQLIAHDVQQAPEPVALENLGHDLAACERNNILVTEAQLMQAGHAAATIRLLRGRVLQRTRANGWSCIGITSAGPGEGKTVTSLNLAISIAREKQRMVYLLDLDMRSPSVCERTGLKPPRPLSQYFTDNLEPHEVLFRAITDNLVVAGNLKPIASASELLATPRLQALLDYIRRRSPGALIVLDLPPVLSTDEALVVAPRADAMFLVVAEGITRRDGLARAVDILSDFTVAGIIMNRSSEPLGSDYYGY
jgi:Mrp family chromosome partitioning ATPase